MTFYGTVAKADTYFLTKRLDVGSLWADEPAGNKTIHLETSTRLIDNLNFIGLKNIVTQVLEFPRGADTAVPEPIEHACYEIAYGLVDGRDVEFELEHIDDVAASFGGSRIRRNPSSASEAKINGIPSEIAWRTLKPYLRNPSEITLSRIN